MLYRQPFSTTHKPRGITTHSMNPVKKHVAIIGAGYAGLAAARTLLASSRVDVTLLEATNRVGGRACTGLLPISKAPVELGATWFHGTQLNPVYDLAVKYGIVKPQPAAAATAAAPAPGQGDQSNNGPEINSANPAAAAAAIPEQPDVTTAVAAAPAAAVPSTDHSSGSSSSSSKADPTGNAAGGPISNHNNTNDSSSNSDIASRWELLLCAPGALEPLSGPQKAAALEAFQQYSSVLEQAEDLTDQIVDQIKPLRNAETAPAAAAGVAGKVAGAVSLHEVSLQDCQQQQQQQRQDGQAAAAGVTLGHLLRQRFDQIMNAVDQAAAAAAAAATAAEDHGGSPGQQQQQRQLDRPHDQTELSELARNLAASPSNSKAFVDGWACRERLQRAYDGFHSTDMAGITHALIYIDLEGPNIPVPGGYQTLAENLAAEVTQLGCNMLYNTPVDQICWDRSDRKVGIQIAAAAAAGSSSSTGGMLFDAVIVTCSLGVLKARSDCMFDPRLPERKMMAIKQLQIGQVDKLFVEWPPPAAAAAAEGPNGSQQRQQGHQIQQQRTIVRGTGSNLVGPRKPKTQIHDFQVQDADISPGAAAGLSSSSSSNGAVFTTYCLLWPTRRNLWGSSWWQQQQQGQQQRWQQQQHFLDLDIPQADPVYVDCLSDSSSSSSTAASSGGTRHDLAPDSLQQQQQLLLPSWLLGLHSWRYGDGPEWIKPTAAAATTGSNDLQQQQRQQRYIAPDRSAVVWVTGRAAVEVGRLEDQAVLRDLEQLLQLYPVIPQPDRINPETLSISDRDLCNCRLLRSDWSGNSYFRGSYSYPGPDAHAQSADDLAAPLTVVQAAAGSSGSSSSSDEAVVCFAGEATSKQYMGTVHGAYISGAREAERLLQQWSL